VDWIYPTLNALFAVVMAAQAIRCRRVLALYWVLASYFGIAILADMAASPFGYARGTIPALMTQAAIGRVSLFVLGCNVCFSFGELVARMPFSAKANMPLTLTSRDRHAGKLLWVYSGLFLMGCIFYLPQLFHFTYYDFVNNDRWLLSRQMFISSMPLGPLAFLRRRYWLAALPLGITVLMVFMVHVRDFLLYSAFPLLIIVLFLPESRGRGPRIGMRLAGVTAAAILIVGFGAYIEFLRTNTVNLPEQGLTRGMYLVIQQVDGGVQMTGLDSIETAAKSLAWPLYNRHVTPDYSLPNDPALYEMVRHVAGRIVGSHFRILGCTGAEELSRVGSQSAISYLDRLHVHARRGSQLVLHGHTTDLHSNGYSSDWFYVGTAPQQEPNTLAAAQTVRVL
jgi:hypothetical protein